jgi:hypothetical protein
VARVVAVGCLVFGLIVGVASSASAAVSPILECVFHDTSTGQYNSLWGYTNSETSTVTRPIPASNAFSPSPANRGQPSSFLGGTNHNNFVVTWDGTAALTWTVQGSTKTATTASPQCASKPVPVFAGTATWVLALPFAFLILGILGLALIARRRGLNIWAWQHT